ncbi:hypothetical protein HFO55_32550 [Rhizobium leguminosarum]|uniref:hypothetical protein n=1 Tax=Rhizobium leguminosarum TaxID=384 RepID=UPI001C928DFD|nr:hypothetical protein [Rhizobium leguminosarum]MBY3180063.1 hypothetical protein [Rhizobium leguminosarum]MBY5571865.1 hypothetical protein [Rhizobium leguminosarum]MBY5578401.1 hypothetical protein [Rhizobium leguminosarum]MBY5585086.1 hypothetical protein [Rhizobium leguminosarum]
MALVFLILALVAALTLLLTFLILLLTILALALAALILIRHVRLPFDVGGTVPTKHPFPEFLGRRGNFDWCDGVQP